MNKFLRGVGVLMAAAALLFGALPAQAAPYYTDVQLYGDAVGGATGFPTLSDDQIDAGNGADQTYTFEFLDTSSVPGTLTWVDWGIGSGMMYAMWTPPSDNSFSGDVTFSYRVTNQNGESVDGTGTLYIAAASGADDAAIEAQTVPSNMLVGEIGTITVTVRNTGQSTWTPGNYTLVPDCNGGCNSSYPWPANNWGSEVTYFVQSDIAPGDAFTASINITAPMTPGMFGIVFRMAHDGTLFGTNGGDTAITVANNNGNGGDFSSIYAYSPMVQSHGWYVDLQFLNNTSDTWYPGSVHVVDVTQGQLWVAGNSEAWESDTYQLNQAVAPGEIATFSVYVTVPPAVGQYPIQFQLADSYDQLVGVATTEQWQEVIHAPVGNVTAFAATDGTVFGAVDLSWTDDPITSYATQYDVYRIPASADPRDPASYTTEAGGFDVGAYFMNASGGAQWYSYADHKYYQFANDGTHFMGRDPITTMAPDGGEWRYVILLCNVVCTGNQFWEVATPADTGYPQLVASGPPQKPMTLSATKGTLPNRVRITWVGDPAATSYTLYRNGVSIANNITAQDFAAGADGYDYALPGPYDTATYTATASNGFGNSVLSNGDTGWPDGGPTGASVTLSGNPTALAKPGDPWPAFGADLSITDPNATLGQPETYLVYFWRNGTLRVSSDTVPGLLMLVQPNGQHGWQFNWMAYDVNSGGPMTQQQQQALLGTSANFDYRVYDSAGLYYDASGTITFTDGSSVGGNPPVGAPATIAATAGTQNDQIVVTWAATPNDGTTTGYTLYRRAASSSYTTSDFSNWTVAASVAYGTNTFTDAVGATTTKYTYAVVATNANGAGPSSLEATGYANVAPSSTSVAFTAVADAASAGAAPATVDPNVVAGEPDTLTYSIVAQPAAGQGTASVVANNLVWTPPAAHDYAGVTTFSYQVTDSGGLSVTGTATVTVSAPAPNAPTGLTASQGTVTDAVRLSWNAVPGAASYNVYRAGNKVNTVALTAITFDSPNTNAPMSPYTVRSVSAAGGESADSASANGYPNIAPSATDAALTATAAVASTPVAPNITDANVTAGESENFTVAILTQPSFGTASVVAKKLIWTPAADHAFSGSVSFTYVVTDTAGASVNGTATVTVAGIAPVSPAGVVATQGTLTDAIQLTWLNSANATGYNVYKGGTKVNTALITGGTAYTDAVTGVAQVGYTVRAVGSTGLESPDSAVAYGFANVAPSATSASLTATAATASAAVTPAVTDANSGEAFTFAVTSQPAAGSAAVVGNKLQWTPASDHAFAGTTTFAYTASDRAGASVSGTATVVVTAVPLAAPGGLAATQGTVTDAVRLTWNAVTNAASYNVYKAGVVVNTAPITSTTFDAPNTNSARVPYTVRSMSGSGAESGDSVASSGYPNLAPISTTATLTATTADASAAVTPAVVDPNVTAGQTETFTVAVTSQPAKGTASVSANKLVWTPGTGATAGAQTFGYSITDKGGASVAGTATVNVTQAVVSPITIKFAPSAGLAPVGGGNYLTYSGTNVAGMVTVTGPKGGMTARITSGNSAVQTLVTTGTSLITMVKTENAQVGTPVAYHIEVTPKGSNTPATADYTFDVKQRGAFLLLRPSFNVNSVTNATINANLGVPAIGGVFAYDPGKQGSWSVQLYSVSSKGVKTPVSTPASSIPSNGALTFDVGTLPPGFNLFTAEATQTDAPANTTPPILKSGTVALFVRNGTAIDATLLTRPATGPAPLHGNVGAWPVSTARLADIGEVQMYVSDDGVSGWTRTLDTKGAATKTLFAPQVLTGDSKKFYKATVVNRWSGLTTETGVGTLQSFVMPAVHVEGPKATIVTHPVTLTAVADNMDASTMEFTWTLRNGPYDPNPQTFTGQSMTYTPSKAGSLSFTLVAKQTTAPNANALASKTAYYSVLVVPPKMPTPIITGPTIVETGKSYVWTGLQPPPFAATLATDLVIKSQWIMPDGTIQTSNPSTYVMKAGDQPRVRYESWFDGYPDSLSFTDHTLQGWTYQWPAMKMTMSVLSPYAPARVQYTAGLASPMNAALLHGETLQYAWSFAPGATVVSQNAGVAVVEYPTVGTYQASAVISDSRGNSSTVTSDAVVVLPTKQLVFSLTLTSSDKWNRPPGPVMARTVVTQLPLSDAPKGVTFFVDGVQVGSQVPSGANINLPDPGTYDVKAVFESVKGATAEVTQSITMQAGDRPACVLKKNGNGTTVLWFQAVCTVQRGYIVGQSWKVNGVASQVTANTISFPAAAIAGTQTVEVTSITDKGQKGGAVFDLGTGVSTPTTP